MLSCSGEDIDEPSLQVDVIQFGGTYQNVHNGNSFTIAIGTDEEP